MSRSVKKGPYAAESLLKKIDEMNQSGKKSVIKTWSRASMIFPEMTGTPLRFMTEESTFPCISPRK